MMNRVNAALDRFNKAMEKSGPCEVCGEADGMPCCGRCDDPDCNAGCIQCRPKEEWDGLTRFIADHPFWFSALAAAYIALILAVKK